MNQQTILSLRRQARLLADLYLDHSVAFTCALEEFRYALVAAALDRNHGKQATAARMLGISRTYLHAIAARIIRAALPGFNVGKWRRRRV